MIAKGAFAGLPADLVPCTVCLHSGAIQFGGIGRTLSWSELPVNCNSTESVRYIHLKVRRWNRVGMSGRTSRREMSGMSAQAIPSMSVTATGVHLEQDVSHTRAIPDTKSSTGDPPGGISPGIPPQSSPGSQGPSGYDTRLWPAPIPAPAREFRLGEVGSVRTSRGLLLQTGRIESSLR